MFISVDSCEINNEVRTIIFLNSLYLENIIWFAYVFKGGKPLKNNRPIKEEERTYPRDLQPTEYCKIASWSDYYKFSS